MTTDPRPPDERSSILSPRMTALIVTLFAALCLHVTAAPGIETEDSAEFATGGRLLCMVHAPGYPLYLLAGRIASVFDSYPGRGMVLLSIFFASLAVGIVAEMTGRRAGSAAGAIAGLTLLFAQGFWEASAGIEVYATQTFLFACLYAALLELRDHPGGRSIRMVGLVIGLTLAHHMGLLILLPAVLAFAWWVSRDRVTMRDLAASIGYAAAGIGAYLVLIILSNRSGVPILWWPPIPDLPTLLYIMSGASFKKLLFAVPLHEAVSRMASFPLRLALWFPVLSLIFAASGIRVLWRDTRALLLLLGAAVAITIIHAANYNVLDPEIFLMPAVVPIALLAGFGMKGLEASGVGAQMRTVGCGLLIATALIGKFLSGGLLSASYNTVPVDVSRAILAAHDARPPRSGEDSDVIWADWRYFPTLRYFQLTEGLGAHVLVELDTTSETPGPTWREGRTWSMRPTPGLGAHYRLVMENFHWRLETGAPTFLPDLVPLEADSRALRADADTPLLTFAGLDLLKIERPVRVRYGEPIDVRLVMRRNALPAGDTVMGEVIVFWGARQRIATPFQPVAWSRPVRALAPGESFIEPIQILVPSAHRGQGEIAEFSLRVRLFDGIREIVYNAGKLEVEE